MMQQPQHPQAQPLPPPPQQSTLPMTAPLKPFAPYRKQLSNSNSNQQVEHQYQHHRRALTEDELEHKYDDDAEEKQRERQQAADTDVEMRPRDGTTTSAAAAHNGDTNKVVTSGELEELQLEEEVQRILTPDQATFLVQHHIRSVEDVMSLSSYRWSHNKPDFPRSLLAALQDRISMGRDHTKPRSCWSEYESCTESRTDANRTITKYNDSNCIATKFELLDTVLADSILSGGGGLHRGEITEIVGISSVGKTQLCNLIATATAMQKQRVCVIDTSFTFDLKEGYRMVTAMFRKPGEQLNLADLSNINIAHATTAESVLSSLESLRRSFAFVPPPALLVIDSLGGVIAPIVGACLGRGHEIMVGVMRCIKALALDFNIAVLTTNYTVGGDMQTSTTKPALGEGWAMLADTRLLLEYTDESTRMSEKRIIRCTCVKSPRKSIGQSFVCQLEPEGFKAIQHVAPHTVR